MGKKIISLEITDELKEALRIAAFNKNLSISAFIRQVIEQEVAEILVKVKEQSNNGANK